MTRNLSEVSMSNRLDEFQSYRARMNERISEIDSLGIKRFFNLDTMAYKNGALPAREKEMLGLVASIVLRCNDCIDYHILQCVQMAGRMKNFTKPSTWPWWSAGVLSFHTCGMPSRAWI